MEKMQRLIDNLSYIQRNFDMYVEEVIRDNEQIVINLKARTSTNYTIIRKYSKILPDVINSINKGIFEQKYLSSYSNGELSINN